MKSNRIIAASLAALLCVTASAQDESITRAAGTGGVYGTQYSLISNIPGRNCTSLDGDWNAVVDPFENGYYNYRKQPMADESTMFADKHFFQNRKVLVEYDFDLAPTMKVPGDWNTRNDRLYYYEGTVWYRRLFDLKTEDGYRYFVHFGGANYETIVGLNGKVLGRHVGGFTPFDFELTPQLREGTNSLVVKVDNKRGRSSVPTDNFDWWNYGGITRSVNIVKVPSTFIIDYCVKLGDGPRTIEGWVKLDGKGREQTTVEIPALGVWATAVPDASGIARFSVQVPSRKEFKLWEPEAPTLYEVKLSCGKDVVSDRIGFRTVTTQGHRILLNGKPIFCKGVAVHDERPDSTSGRAFTMEHARTTLGWVKEMGGNFVRLAHYPHDENMVRAAEEMGIMVWSEIPVYWTIDWTNPDTYANAENQLTEMITRDRNRANVIIWSVANETPRSPERLEFLSRLIARARELDGSRLVSAAMEKEVLPDGRLTVDDELLQYADLISYNQYVGWYDGDSDKCKRVNWTFPVDKPVIVSEFGGGAKYGLHGSVKDRFTEEYLVELYKQNVEMLSRIPELAGTTPWVLKDFRSPRRYLPGIQDDFNRKGLVSEYGEKKDAFYVMQNWYRGMFPLDYQGQVVHIAGDSTTADYYAFNRGLCGWGQAIRNYLKVPVYNHAVGGRSTKSFINEGRWDKLMKNVKAGDVVFINFGHNDEKKKDESRYCAPDGAYYDNLCRFVAEVRAKGATPVLFTPMARRQFNADGSMKNTHSTYPEAMKRAAADTRTEVIDLNSISTALLTAAGPEASKNFFVLAKDGSQDNSHTNIVGADLIARNLAEALSKSRNREIKSILK